MVDAGKSETVSLFAVWKANRVGLPAFGLCCGMVRAGEVPGAFSIDHGSLVVISDRASEAVAAMRVARLPSSGKDEK